MIKLLAATTRDRARLSEILGVATRFGLGWLLGRIGIGSPGDADQDAATLPRRTREALEALGPTFVKMGQILATRGDLIGPEWTSELDQLHSDAPRLPFEAIRDAVEAALGEPPETAFASFDPEPLAAASMAQVHRATLRDGREVVLKIRRPGIRPQMEADLRLLAGLAEAIEASNAEARRFQPLAMARQLARALLEELDFTHEGRNADRLREDLARNPDVVVPVIHWQWSSETLLVMDHVAGVKPDSAERLVEAGIDPQAIADLGADLVLEMVMINGRFHGDPHPGNLLCLPGNRLALLDLGSVGQVSARRRDEFVGFLQSLQSGDPAALADTLAVWSADANVPRSRIERAAGEVVARHGQGPLVMSKLVPDFLRLLREDGLVMPPDLLLMFKALMTMDGVLTRIAPGFDLSAAMRRAQGRILADRLSPERWAATAQAMVWELSRIGNGAPRLIQAAVRRLEAEPPAQASSGAAILTAGRWIAWSILGGGGLIAAALIVS
ncbi:AarF/UbiB family protein [Sphingomonas sp. HF-S3]|uniref:AarF/UbiB family protein n=1 Tax=Sphingomonas rustica TaxID=3103142 RepID=A0ABV0B235_9SPHN